MLPMPGFAISQNVASCSQSSRKYIYGCQINLLRAVKKLCRYLTQGSIPSSHRCQPTARRPNSYFRDIASDPCTKCDGGIHEQICSNSVAPSHCLKKEIQKDCVSGSLLRGAEGQQRLGPCGPRRLRYADAQRNYGNAFSHSRSFASRSAHHFSPPVPARGAQRTPEPSANPQTSAEQRFLMMLIKF